MSEFTQSNQRTHLTKSHYLYTKDANGDPTCALLGVGDFAITCNALIKGFITEA